MADITSELIQDRSWYGVNDSYEQVLTNLTDRLKAAGLQPGTPEYDGAFNSIVGMVSKSTIDLTDTIYSDPTTQNNALVNWMKQNFTYEMASKMGVDVNTTLYSPDFSGWTTPSGEFVKANDPWARDRYGERILDESGNPILTPVYAFTQLFEQLYGRKPTAAEIDAGTRDVIAAEGWTAAGRTMGYSGSPVSSGSTVATTPTAYKFNPVTGQYESLATSAYLEKQRQSAFELMSARFKEYGLDSLIPLMKQMVWDDVSEDTMWLRLQETDTFKQRFSANEARRKAGLRVLSVPEYVQYEDAYRQVIRAFGLKQFDNDEYVSRFLANDISITELTNRVTIAAKRVKDMPNVVNELKSYYGSVIGDSDILGYVLDPKNELPRIERMVTAAEIGAAAQEQGLQVAGAKTSSLEQIAAEDLAAYGVTQEQARQGYSTIAELLPGAEKLSQIYGTRLDAYGQAEAEQEVFKGAASARRARQKLAATEAGTFSGGAGVARGALASERNL
jgi:hypothetical protein